MEVGRVSKSFILRSIQQEEALHHIRYTLKSGKTALCGSPAAVTQRRGAGWSGARVRELHPQVRATRGGFSSHLRFSLLNPSPAICRKVAIIR
ncbi:unnamed protein product [Spirodela intermedia]|uniref:Uncharacterized protein n=1 Tax=Spirodela intermedia TaxID=51605 RepID=A0ABN7E943_SPIIN|nr:unnamed protein product [Spirodela intermedia]